MTLLTAAKDNYIAELGGLVITTDGVEHAPQFPTHDGWQPLEAVAGLYIKPLLVPGQEYSDYFTSRGEAGVHAERTSIPQSSQFTVITGAILWQQESVGNGMRRRLEAGDSARLAPYECHSYVFLEDCVCVVVITPPLSHRTPRPVL